MSNLRRSTKAASDMSAPANLLSSSLGKFLLVLCWRGTRFHNQSACGDEDVLIVLIP
jgi:hypothetical protein